MRVSAATLLIHAVKARARVAEEEARACAALADSAVRAAARVLEASADVGVSQLPAACDAQVGAPEPLEAKGQTGGGIDDVDLLPEADGEAVNAAVVLAVLGW